MTRRPPKAREKKLTEEQVEVIDSIDGRRVSSRDSFDLGICTPTPPEIEEDVNILSASSLEESFLLDSILELESSARTSKRRRQPKIMADGLPAIIIPPVRSKSLCSMSEQISSQGLLINTSHLVQRDPEVLILCPVNVDDNPAIKNHSASSMISLSSDCENSPLLPKTSTNHMAWNFDSGVVNLAAETPCFGSISRVIESLNVLDHNISNTHITSNEVASISRRIDFIDSLPTLVTDSGDMAVSDDVIFSTSEAHVVNVGDTSSNISEVACQSPFMYSTPVLEGIVNGVHNSVRPVLSSTLHTILSLASGGHTNGELNPVMAAIDSGNAIPLTPMAYNCGSNIGEVASSSTTRNNSEPGTFFLQANHNSGSGFLELSNADWKKVIEDSSDKSVKVNNWARHKFDSWRVFMGMSIERKIEEILYSELGGLIANFFLMCCKTNGE